MSQPGFDSTELPVLEPRTRCVLIARDPHFIYAYWDYTEHDINHLRNQLKFDAADAQLILRVHDITSVRFNGSNANHTWDLDVGFSTKSWYVHVWQDNADYCAELGIRSGDDHFLPLMRSNTVRTPPKTASSRNDLIWQDIKVHKESRPYIKENIKERYQELMQKHSKKVASRSKRSSSPRVYQLTAQDIRDYYMRLFAKVSPRGRGKVKKGDPSIEQILKGGSSAIHWQKVRPLVVTPDLIKAFHVGASIGHLQEQGASEQLLAPPAGGSEERLVLRKFFFEIWTELLVYGRTEADAKVLLNEKDVKLNPDGTFSLRYALPDGDIPLKFIAQSSDGVEQRHIYTRVEREKTVQFPKMLKDPHG